MRDNRKRQQQHTNERSKGRSTPDPEQETLLSQPESMSDRAGVTEQKPHSPKGKFSAKAAKPSSILWPRIRKISILGPPECKSRSQIFCILGPPEYISRIQILEAKLWPRIL